MPWANAVIEAELPRLGADTLVWHYARLVPSGRQTGLDDAFLTGIIRAVPAALTQLSQLDLALVQLGCTSAGFAVPSDHERTVALHNGRLLDAFGAILHTLELLNARRIALLTPYPDRVGRREVASFASNGIQVLTSAHLDLRDGYRHIGPTQIRTLLRTLHPPLLRACDCLVLSCTGWPTLELLPELERSLGCPVVSSNVAMAICALSLG